MFVLKAKSGKKVFLFILIVILTGCATLPPLQHEIQTEETYPVLYDDLWEPMSSFFVNRVAAVETVDKESGILKTKEFSVPYESFRYRSEYTDCGAPGGLYVYRHIIGHFELRVSETEEDFILVKISPHYRASLWLGNSFEGWVTCQSKGYVEKLLFDDLRLKLKDSPKVKARSIAKKEKPSFLTLIDGTVWNIELTPDEEGKEEPDISQPPKKVKKDPDIFLPEQGITVKCIHILPPLGDDLFRKLSTGALEKGPPFSSFRYNLFENESKRLPGE